MSGLAPTPVPILQHESEFALLLEIYRERAPRTVLEVGTYHGGTLYHWLQNAAPGSVIVSVDDYTAGVDNRALYDSWCARGATVVAIAGDSHGPRTVAQALEHAPYEWVWIDAAHRIEDVTKDWELYGAMCAAGGLVCFHDILPSSDPTIEVDRLWRYLRRRYKSLEIVDDPDAAWGGIGCVAL